MSLYWGVDSFNPANHMIHVPASLRANGAPEHQTLFDFVVMRATALTGGKNTVPTFWGRYLNNYGYGLSIGEKDFIFDRSGGGCRILLVYNGPRSPLVGYNAGYQAGERACNLARALNVPEGVRIYADLENWRVDTEWILGWCDSMYRSEFAGMGGLYGRGAELANPFGLGGRPLYPHGSWSNSASRAADQQAAGLFQELLDQLATGRIAKSVSNYVWSNMPRRGGDPRPGEQMVPSSLGAVSPAGPLIETAIWQYRLNCALGTNHPLIDMDMATERGYGDMWSRTRGG